MASPGSLPAGGDWDKGGFSPYTDVTLLAALNIYLLLIHVQQWTIPQTAVAQWPALDHPPLGGDRDKGGFSPDTDVTLLAALNRYLQTHVQQWTILQTTVAQWPALDHTRWAETGTRAASLPIRTSPC
ncbi:hypothetical protein O0L34_g14469 [Tuta absoluta]|nr:hypothetical protein O0L34_g14469 [Tuta absoluta]